MANTIYPKVINRLSNAINKGDTFELIDCMRQISSIMGDWETHIRWSAQTLHQAHHQDDEGTWETCPKNTCQSAQQVLHVHPTPDEEKEAMAQRLLDEGMDPEVVEQIKKAEATCIHGMPVDVPSDQSCIQCGGKRLV